MTKALEDGRFSDHLTVFTNCEPVPGFEGGRVREAIEGDLAQGHDTDIYLLCNDSQQDESGETIGFRDFKPQYEQFPSDFAFVVPGPQKDKVVEIFKKSPMPINKTILEASRRLKLKVRVSNIGLFKKSGKKTAARQADPKEWKVAALIPSYKRFEDVIRQIHGMLGQSYPPDIYVAVKGLSKYHVENILKPMFRSALEAGKLHVNYYPNSNQLANLIDPIRGYDVEPYDLFAKIDDDDFYGPDYFRHLIDFHNTIPYGYSSFHKEHYLHYSMNNGMPRFKTEWGWIFGRTLVFTREVLKKMQAIDADPDVIGDVCNEVRTCHQDSTSFSFNEDNLVRMLMCESGAINRAPYLKSRRISNDVIAQENNNSVLRGNLVAHDFSSHNGHLGDKNVEHFIYLRNPMCGWEDIGRIFRNRMSLVNNGGCADVLSLSPDSILVKWDDWGIEGFKVKGDFSYELDPYSKKLDEILGETDADQACKFIGKILPRYGLMNVFQDRHTVIPCLMSVCPIFDKILITYHHGANDDGSIDLVMDFIRKGKNKDCEIVVKPYPHDVYFVNDPMFLEGKIDRKSAFGSFREKAQKDLVAEFGRDHSHHWALIDSDQVYITHLFEKTFKKADLFTLQGKPATIKRMGYDSMPQDNRIRVCKHNFHMGTCGDHLTVNSLAEFVFELNPNDGGDHRFIRSRIDDRNVHHETNDGISWFHFRKGMWRGAPPKVRANEDELVDFSDELKDQFEEHVRPLLIEAGSEYAGLEF